MVVFEVGVGPLSTCRSRPYWDKHKCVLFEPLWNFYHEINKAIKPSNVIVHNIAIYDYNGKCEFIQNDQLSSIKGIHSPAFQIGQRGGNITVCDCAKIREFDKGDINLLFLDMEGSEWFVLKHLISRPKKIVIETSSPGYVNPFLKEIHGWMWENKYKEVGRDGPDIIWIKKHKIFI